MLILNLLIKSNLDEYRSKIHKAFNRADFLTMAEIAAYKSEKLELFKFGGYVYLCNAGLYRRWDIQTGNQCFIQDKG